MEHAQSETLGDSWQTRFYMSHTSLLAANKGPTPSNLYFSFHRWSSYTLAPMSCTCFDAGLLLAIGE